MKKWIYSKPQFECDKLNHDLLCYAPWSGHRNFAYDFINYFRPKVLVELGSHYGCSAFAFAQAAKDFELDTRLCFVDTWQGDDFTKKYDNDVYTIFSRTVDEFYKNQNINMMKMTFNEAVSEFENGSVDVLHIDGSHHYDDVKGDFENWLPKVSKKGIILLHDISSDIVLGDVMGSYKFWLELQAQYKYTASFDFSWGLGIIFLNRKMYEDFMEKVDLSKYQRNNNALDVEYKDQLRKNYFKLKDNQIYIDDLLSQKKILNGHLDAYKKDVKAKEEYIKDYEKETIAAYEKDKNDIIASYEANIKKTIENYEANIKNTVESYEADMKNTTNSYEETIKGKDDYIGQLEDTGSQMRERIDFLEQKLMRLEYALKHPVRFKLSQLKSKK